MKLLTLVSIAFALINTSIISANDTVNDTPAFRAVQEFFAGLATFDENRMRNTMTDDFELLEMGEVWDTDKLVNTVMPYKGMIKRQNFFDLITYKHNGDSVWVSYWNKAQKQTSKGEKQDLWLESAVIIKTDTGWKMQMLHSTGITNTDLPDDIAFTEYPHH